MIMGLACHVAMFANLNALSESHSMHTRFCSRLWGTTAEGQSARPPLSSSLAAALFNSL